MTKSNLSSSNLSTTTRPNNGPLLLSTTDKKLSTFLNSLILNAKNSSKTKKIKNKLYLKTRMPSEETKVDSTKTTTITIIRETNSKKAMKDNPCPHPTPSPKPKMGLKCHLSSEMPANKISTSETRKRPSTPTKITSTTKSTKNTTIRDFKA